MDSVLSQPSGTPNTRLLRLIWPVAAAAFVLFGVLVLGVALPIAVREVSSEPARMAGPIVCFRYPGTAIGPWRPGGARYGFDGAPAVPRAMDATLGAADPHADGVRRSRWTGSDPVACAEPLTLAWRHDRRWNGSPADADALVPPGTDWRRDTLRDTSILILMISLAALGTLVLLPWLQLRRLLAWIGEMEAALALSEARARAARVTMAGGVTVEEGPGRVAGASPNAEPLIAPCAGDCRDRPLITTLQLPRDDGGARTGPPGDPAPDEPPGGHSLEVLLHRVDGDELAVRATAASIDSAATRSGATPRGGQVLVLQSLVREREFVRQLAWQAAHDTLTGLVNRAEFERHFASACARGNGHAGALLFLDLDRFRLVNDTCGYAAGDAMLREIAGRFTACLGPDDVIARFGGDEFCILLHGASDAEIERSAERLRATLDGFVFVWDGQPFPVTVSIGVTILRAGEHDWRIEDAVRLADLACGVAKERGRNRVQLADPLDRTLAHHISDVSWSSRVRQALKFGDFCLYVQPIVDTRAHSGGGAQPGCRGELLLRMGSLGGTHGGEIAPPGLFIPAAERYGLMTEIDRWVVRTVLESLARIPRRRFSEYAINLSGASVGDERFLAFVREQFERTGVPAQLVCFEITETAAIVNLDGASRFIRELKALGCRFALDDFGAGMSSFGYLKQLPVEYLKIDGSFVTDLASNPANLGIIASINDIGHAMNCKTVAEYVDSAATLQKLSALGVDYAQGYYIGRPMPWNEAWGV
ncbi:putative bifunctional diguanylate cyclase/phosphodiesterase [Burkholderia alba]|uniref:putative bifunctional diguanylate cyclase/phosphodiesterase n=1 Tax=Burkholderia alba TaxID=2683677 RepID=UPI002B05876F|nr:EAL domain-containing protein [Burkholderia alba]